ncbi:MAG: MBL fold metallo-hydrolase [Candidatus Geothermarchaeales archaeon]
MSVRELNITTIIDNTVQALVPTKRVIRQTASFIKPEDRVVAEHGLSLLIEADDTKILFDTGLTPRNTLNNIGALRIPVGEVDLITLSHGHLDHTGSTVGALKAIGRPTRVHIHPDLFTKRYLVGARGKKYMIGVPDGEGRGRIEGAGGEIVTNRGVEEIARGVYLSGEVKRYTPMESKKLCVEVKGKLIPDPLMDDQSIAVDLGGRGLAVITGCAHAGVLNILRHFTEQLNKDVYCLFGGFHLTEAMPPRALETAIEGIAEYNPRYVCPMHCVEPSGMVALVNRFREKYVYNCVGTRFTPR